MKKSIVIGIVAALATSSVIAQNNDIVVTPNQDKATFTPASADVNVRADLGLFTSYVWRGQVLNNDLVVQPQVDISKMGVHLNIFGNYDLKKNYNGNSGDFSEIDLTLGYDLPLQLDNVDFSIGLINYNFSGKNPAEATTELYGSAVLTTFKKENGLSFTPSFTLYGDIDEVNGVYLEFQIPVRYPLPIEAISLTVEGGITVGWGNTAYNSYYWDQSADGNWNDYNFYGTITYAIRSDLLLNLNMTYTMLEGGAIRDGGDANYEADNKFWSGINLSYKF